MRNRLTNYVRARRKRAGLSQRELAWILGYENEGAISRHELFRSVPPLLIALAYEVTFQATIAELFPGLREVVEDAIEKRLAEFEGNMLEKRHGKDNRPNGVSRKLEWLKLRRGPTR